MKVKKIYIIFTSSLILLIFVRAILIPKFIYVSLEVTHHKTRCAALSKILAVHRYHSVIKVGRSFYPDHSLRDKNGVKELRERGKKVRFVEMPRRIRLEYTGEIPASNSPTATMGTASLSWACISHLFIKLPSSRRVSGR